MGYVTLASQGNAIDYGDMTQSKNQLCGFASPTRGVWAGGNVGPITNVIEYATISSTGNNTDFGQVILLEDNVDGNAESNQLLLEGGGRLELEESEFTKLTGSGVVDQNNANVAENVGILLENFGQILLDGTDDSSSNSGEHILQETGKLDRFIIERSGSIVAEAFSTRAVVERIITHNDENIILEDIVGDNINRARVLEYLYTGKLRNLWLFGRSGTVKTSLAKIIVDQLKAYHSYINASDESGIDTISVKRIPFAWSIGCNGLKIVILDKAD